jgi:hypothetical protein
MHSHNVSQASQASQTDSSDKGCDLRNQEGADRYKEEVERLREGTKKEHGL